MKRRRRRKSSKPFPAKLFREAYSEPPCKFWHVYVIQSLTVLTKKGVGYTYVGATNNPRRRLRQHNGDLSGGARSTFRGRPWIPRALFGPYQDRREAMRAEYALKHGKRGENRCRWASTDSKWCRGAGPDHPWVADPTVAVEPL